MVRHAYRILTMTRYNLKIDLHMHTSCSDGHLSPQELIHLVLRNHIEIVGIVDHNTIAGASEAIRIAEQINKNAKLMKIFVIPGIEFSTGLGKNRIEIVGLFVNVHSPSIKDCALRVKQGYFERARIQLKRLREVGVTITYDEYKRSVKNRVPNWKTLAEAIVDKGYARSIDEAADLYTRKGKPGYVSYAEKWPKIHPNDAIDAIRKAGGLAFVGHLGDIEEEVGTTRTKKILQLLLKAGLDGMDCSLRNRFHSPISKDLEEFINRKRLLKIRGSDFHKDESPIGFCLKRKTFCNLLLKEIRRLAERKEVSRILEDISFKDLRFFPVDIIPDSFVYYVPGMRDNLLKRKVNSSYQLLKSMVFEDKHRKIFLDIGFGSILFALHCIRGESYLDEIASKNRSDEVEEVLNDRLQGTRSIQFVESDVSRKFLDDNLWLYFPMAYRLCYYKIGFRLKTESLKKLHPKLWRDIEGMYHFIVNKTGLTLQEIQRYMDHKKEHLSRVFQNEGYQKIEIHSRVKRPLSVWNKLKMCWFVGYDWRKPDYKQDGRAVIEELCHFLKKDFSRASRCKEIDSLFEDLVGFRIIVKDADELDYSTMKKCTSNLLSEIYRSEVRPRRWHHRRLLVWGRDMYLGQKLPIEIQIMSWRDYLLSRTYYWYSKGNYLHRDLYPIDIPVTLKNLEYDDLHSILLKEIREKLERLPNEER